MVSVIVRSVPGVGAGVVYVQADSETGRGGRVGLWGTDTESAPPS